jgi:hypothetical protein
MRVWRSSRSRSGERRTGKIVVVGIVGSAIQTA